ncbi:MAG: periplasmic heavy metal sensor, partial [Thermodesulfobacteriota bacterium]
GAPPAAAQPPGDRPPMAGAGFGRPMFLEHLFRPELVMRHQGALGLTQEQKTAISGAIKRAQDRLGPLQWDVEAKAEAVEKLVDQSKVDVDQALAAAAEVIALEGKIKQEHVRLLLEIKNVLTPEQQQKLAELRPDRRGPERGHRPPLDRPVPSR